MIVTRVKSGPALRLSDLHLGEENYLVCFSVSSEGLHPHFALRSSHQWFTVILKIDENVTLEPKSYEIRAYSFRHPGVYLPFQFCDPPSNVRIFPA